MASIHNRHPILLCSASLLALSFTVAPIDFSQLRPTLHKAQAQEYSCFIAGTSVLMADGSQRAIEAVHVGDRVVGRRGRINTVRGCERTVLGARRLYGLNGSRPFVTAEHPFLTVEGWKALDPEATRSENAALSVGALQIGDQLCRGVLRIVGGERRSTPDAPGCLFLQRTTTLEAVAAVVAPADTPVFNLLLDGDHSYVADGWIVHNKGGTDSFVGEDGTVVDATTAETAGGSAAPPLPATGAIDPGAGGGASPSTGSEPVAEFLSDLGIRSPDQAGLQPTTGPLTREQEEGLISRGWRQRQ